MAARFTILGCVMLVGPEALAQPVPATGSPPSPTAGPSAADTAPDDRPLTALPYSPGLDTASMDRSADACTDFYQYSCGGWIAHNPIPADQSSWSVYGKLAADNQRFLWGILEQLASRTDARTPSQQKAGDYFAACMDEAAVERAGLAPLQPTLDRIAGLRSLRDLPPLLAALQAATGDDGLFFGFGASQDYGDSSQVIAFATAGGLSLPDRDYYTRPDARSRQLRAQYLAHVAQVFTLLGDTPEAALQEAGTVLRTETALADASLTRVDKRDPHKLYHRMPVAGLQALTPGFDWTAYFAALGMPPPRVVNVSEPAFFKALSAQWRQAPLADVRTYLRWHVVAAASPTLPARFTLAHFDFFSHTLHGVPVQRPRWKRCVALVNDQLGDALGQEFVARAFSPTLKATTLQMTRQVEAAMAADIADLDWMSPATKRRATEKLHAVVDKIGYPDHWRDYSALAIDRGDLHGNVERATLFETRRQLAKIGRPLDRGEWGMSAPTVNAYYDPQMNDINFPAGVLQPPLYDPAMDDAPNYGNTGGTIGHELTHGFDDEGRQFDAKGTLSDWWTPPDAKAFEQRTQCIVDQYAQYTVVDDIKINSRLTLGEDVADLGGLLLAYSAWKVQLAAPAVAPLRDGMTPDQRFFVGNAQWACENDRPENLRVHAATDPHSPGKYRVNGLVANMPQFARAFACHPGQPMVRAHPCRVW